MARKAARGLFITGTDTGVGKTYVAALICRALRAAGHSVGVYKPAASGCRREGDRLVSDDAVALWEAGGRPRRLADVCPQRFAAPLAPHLAAREEGQEIDLELLRTGIDVWRDSSDVVIVEGAGGLLSPLSDNLLVADLVHELKYPLVIVAPNRLGAVNQTLLTVAAARAWRGGLPVAGIVLNHPHAGAGDLSTQTNASEIERLLNTSLLAQITWQATAFGREIDWFTLAAEPARPAKDPAL